MADTPCGRFFRAEHTEGRGPRGGRCTYSTVVCVDCGTRSDPVKDTRPGSRDGVDEAQQRLLARVCCAPRAEHPSERLLRAVSTCLCDDARPKLPLAVMLTAEGGPAAALARAWADCPSGHAMGAVWHNYVHAAFRRSGLSLTNQLWSPWPFTYIRTSDGASVNVGVVFDGTTIVGPASVLDGTGLVLQLSGADAAVADALRRQIPQPDWTPVLDELGLGGVEKP